MSKIYMYSLQQSHLSNGKKDDNIWNLTCTNNEHQYQITLSSDSENVEWYSSLAKHWWRRQNVIEMFGWFVFLERERLYVQKWDSTILTAMSVNRVTCFFRVNKKTSFSVFFRHLLKSKHNFQCQSPFQFNDRRIRQIRTTLLIRGED